MFALEKEKEHLLEIKTFAKGFAILIVEDDSSLKEHLKILLSNLFDHIDTAENGEEGLEKYNSFYNQNSRYYNIVITDINMPKRNGIDMIDEIKQIEDHQAILVMSAHNEAKYLSRLIQLNVDGFIEKPYKLESMFKVIHRVTKHIYQEQELLQYNKNLEDEVKKRTEDIKELNIKLQDQVNELKILREDQINSIKLKSIGKLAAGITHEINTPLTYLKGNLEIIKMDIDDISQICDLKKYSFDESFATLFEAISRVSSIVNATREISSQTKNEPQELNVYSTIINSLIMVYNRSKQITNIYINDQLFNLGIDKNREEYNSFGEKQRLEQVWVILLNNAIDEISKSEKIFDDRYIKINIFKQSDDIIIKIIDNGGGIDNNVLEKIFSPFISNKSESSGMGLGLNIAKKIIDDMNGTIVAENTIENNQKCAKFTIKLKSYNEKM
jgi:C4-dicarboxylate-specific signal transduction histidine kinase